MSLTAYHAKLFAHELTPGMECHNRMKGMEVQCSIVKLPQLALAVVQVHGPELRQ
jgi:hypothetical protein